jgi:ribosome-associated toxin RatA of RatAB toxin-antitoxin module
MKYIILLALLCLNIFANEIFLSTEQLIELKENGYVIKRDKINKTGFISFDVNRDIDKVFYDIINLKNYPKLINDVAKVDIYEKDKNIVKAKIFIESFFINFHNSVIHTIIKNKYTVKWTLDKTQDNDNYFSKMDGYWVLKRINNKTRIFYSNDLEFKSWVPGFLENYLFEKGLMESTSWLYSENEDVEQSIFI